jgi:hypothetical protein
MRSISMLAASTLAALLVLFPAAPPEAQACGGFFCSSSPIDQVGEQIIFGVEGDTVEATIMIQYAGEAKDFAWVVPVASEPTVTLGSWAMFQNLGWSTAPSYSLQWDYEQMECGWWNMYAEADGGALAGSDPTEDGVEVVAEDEVGPYDYAVLKSDDAQALWDWLDKEGFDQPEASVPLIAHYVTQGMLFLALKLKQDAGAGDIQPITLTVDENAPCVPLVLTQIAAQPDMPVLAWIFGEMRGIPTNWFNVLINEKKIDWLNYGQNYAEVVTQAVDEAAGHGFVTEYAGGSDIVYDVYYEGQCDADQLASITDPETFMMQMLQLNCPRDPTSQGVIKKHIPKPDDLPEDCQSDQAFYTWNLEECLGHMPEDWTFDGAAMAADVEEKITGPLKAAQALLDKHPYLTRLYTTVSPDEMNRDPFFAFNPELEDVSNHHTAMGTGECTEEGNVTNIVLTLENGDTISIEGEFEPWAPMVEGDYAAGEPAAAEIQLIGESGQPHVVPRESVSEVDERLNTENPEIIIADLEAGLIDPGTPTNPPDTGNPDDNKPEPPDEDTDPVDPGPAPLSGDDSGSSNSSGSSGCAGGGAPILPWLVSLSVLTAAVLRRREG